MALVIESSPQSTPPRRGDFGAFVEGGRLLVPRKLRQLLEEGQITTAEDFVAFLQVFSSSIADNLGWEISEVDAARGILLDLLKSHVRRELLFPGAVRSRHPGVTPARWKR
jgi:hypothetical protein